MNRISKSILAASIILFGVNLFISIPGLTDSSIEIEAERSRSTEEVEIYLAVDKSTSANIFSNSQPLIRAQQVMSAPVKKAPYDGPANITSLVRQGGDNIASATVINSLPYSDEGTTTGFSDFYNSICYYSSSGSPDVWYSYTPDTDELISISLCDSEYNTELWVFENTLYNPVCCNENICGSDHLKSAIWGAQLTGGNTYYIAVDGYDGDHGEYRLFVDYFKRPNLECPPDATPEGEPTGCESPDITNGGCFSDPPVFGSISCGETVCGTAGNFKHSVYNYRDVDWYELIVSENSFITWTVQAEFAVLIGIALTDPAGSGDCEDNTGFIWPAAKGAPGDEISVSASLAPGTYWFWVSPPNSMSAAPCDAKYTASISCETSVISCPPNAIPEGEPTGCDYPDTTNGGCVWDVPLFSSISCGDTICGTSGYNYSVQAGGFFRDTDWYQFEITEASTITLSVLAEFPAVIDLVYTSPLGSDDCGDISGESFKNAPAFENVSLKRFLPPGIYWALIFPYKYVPVHCNATYVTALTCEIEIDPTLGRCCYGDPKSPDCDNLSLYNCWAFTDFISWDSLSDCTEPCPIAQPGQCCYGDPYNPNCIEEIQIDCEDRSDFISWSADSDCSAPCSIPLFDQSNIFSGSYRDINAIDLDKDNNIDLIVSDYFPDVRWNLRIAYGRGDGTFETPVKVLTDYDIFTFAFINNDDLIDIVALGRNNSTFHNSIAVLLNQGNRSFSISYYPHDHQENVTPTGMATGYFNNDVFVDIAAPPNKVYFGNSQGSFDAINSATLPSTCYSVDVGDFNNDGIDDIIGISSTNQAEIYTSDGSGNFSKTGGFDLPYWTIDVTTANSLADYNHDGNMDVATVVNEPGGRSFILIGFGNGQGGISYVNTLTFNGSSFYLASTDVNRDNNLDLIASDFFNGALQIYYGDESGNFDEHIMADIGTGLSPTILATGDFDRDGNPDFVAGYRQKGDKLEGSYPLRLLLNNLPDAPVIDDPEMMMVTTGYDNVSIEVKNPDLFNISRNYTTIAGSDYWRLDYNENGEIDETAIDYNLQYGEYEINITPRYGADMNGEFSTGIRINGTETAVIFQNYRMSDLKRSSKGSGVEFVFYYEVEAESSIQPPNGWASDPQPTFDWSGLLHKYSSSESYSFQISPYYDFNRSVNETTDLLTPSLALDSLLGYDSVFYWRARGSDWPDYSRTFAVHIIDDATDIFEEYDNGQSKLPSEFRLFQNYPNPFNLVTNISFSLPRSCDNIKVEIFNILGQKIITLVDYSLEAGNYTVQWNGGNTDGKCVGSGVYFYRVEAEKFIETKKMLLLK